MVIARRARQPDIGDPFHNLVVVVDMPPMAISHGSAGEDHIRLTPQAALLYEALGGSPAGDCPHPV